MAFAFAVRMLEFDESNIELETMSKVISGLVNNFPAALPNPFVTANEKRRAFRRLGLQLSPGTFLKDAPVTHVPKAMVTSIEAYSVKITQALWYKEKKTVVPRGYFHSTLWRQVVDHQASKIFENAIKITPIVIIGSRSNVDIGNRFVYRCNYAFDPDLMMVAMQFGKSIASVCIIAEPKAKDKMNFIDDWKPVDKVFNDPVFEA